MDHSPSPGGVVVGVDGSDDSRAAVAAATDEARRRKAPLHLVTVTSWPLHDVARAVGAHADLAGTVRGSAGTLLRDLAADAADVLGTDRVSWSVDDGDPVEALARAAAGAQVLVLGSRGVGGVTGLLLGSTAAGLVTAAPCPVLVLPDDTATVVHGRSSVVVGVAGAPCDDGADADVLAYAVAEALSRGTDLVAVHAWRDVALETAFRSLGPLVDWAGVRADEERALAEAVAGWAEKEPDLVLRQVVVRNRTAPALLAASLAAELLVVGHRRRRVPTRLGSTTHAVLHRAGCPVAVVPVGGTR